MHESQPSWSKDLPGASPPPSPESNAAGSYENRVASVLRALGISEDYGPHRGLELQLEASTLVTARVLPDGREIQLTSVVATNWQAMVQAAASENVTLILISGFRSVAYQRQLIERKLSRGQTLEQILRVSAAPGYSEHHTGRAIDIGTPGCKSLEEEFESTGAFRWLQLNSARFGFFMTYPRFNLHRIVYEPWHWLYRP